MNLASLFNLAGPDLLIILMIVLLLFGAKKLPPLARGMGQTVEEFSKAMNDFIRKETPPPEPIEPAPPAGLLRRLRIGLRCIYILTLVI